MGPLPEIEFLAQVTYLGRGAYERLLFFYLTSPDGILINFNDNIQHNCSVTTDGHSLGDEIEVCRLSL